MIDARQLEDLAGRLAGALPPWLGPVRKEIKDNLRAVLQSQLARLDLIGREEFEAARAMLARSRARIEELEARVDELERGMAGK